MLYFNLFTLFKTEWNQGQVIEWNQVTAVVKSNEEIGVGRSELGGLILQFVNE